MTFQFTANDGNRDGGGYQVTLTGSLLGYIRVTEAIVADSSAYWTKDDFYAGPESVSECLGFRLALKRRAPVTAIIT